MIAESSDVSKLPTSQYGTPGGGAPLLSGEMVDRGTYSVTLHNQSHQPVTEPLVVARLLPPNRLEERVGHRGIPRKWLDKRSPLASIGGAGPTAIADSFKDDSGISLSHVPPGGVVEHLIPLPLPTTCYDVAVTFRDAAGLAWRREVSTGRLEPARRMSFNGIARWITRALRKRVVN